MSAPCVVAAVMLRMLLVLLLLRALSSESLTVVSKKLAHHSMNVLQRCATCCPVTASCPARNHSIAMREFILRSLGTSI